jgi:hypothetical protein
VGFWMGRTGLGIPKEVGHEHPHWKPAKRAGPGIPRD